jgi:hypothetical protein
MSKKIIKFVETTGKEKCTGMLENLVKEGLIDKNLDIKDRVEKEFKEQEIKRCEAMVYNGKRQCGLDAIVDSCYCKRHKRYDNTMNSTDEKQIYQCIVITPEGNRCCKVVREENEMCYIHKVQKSFSKEPSRKYICVYNSEFTEEYEDEDTNIKCTRIAKNGTWFCGYHKRFQVLACEMYKSKSHIDYLKKIGDNKIKKDAYIDDNIERLN